MSWRVDEPGHGHWARSTANGGPDGVGLEAGAVGGFRLGLDGLAGGVCRSAAKRSRSSYSRGVGSGVGGLPCIVGGPGERVGDLAY